MTSQNNSSSNNNNASWYIFGVKSRDKSSQAIYTLEYSIGGMALALGSHSMYSRVAEKNQDHQVKAISFFNGLCQP